LDICEQNGWEVQEMDRYRQDTKRHAVGDCFCHSCAVISSLSIAKSSKDTGRAFVSQGHKQARKKAGNQHETSQDAFKDSVMPK
jgi:hypothetical protein